MGKRGTKVPTWTDRLNDMQRLCESWNAKYAKYPLIGFGYRSFVGRKTAARAAEVTACYSFADTISRFAERFNPHIESAGLHLVEVLERDGIDNMKTVEGVRIFFQELGKGSQFSFSQTEVWTRLVISQAEMMMKAGHPVAITDVRIPDEAIAIKEAGGIIVKINRPDVPILEHPSEHALDDWDDWDLVIDNDGTLEEFRQKCKALFVVK